MAYFPKSQIKTGLYTNGGSYQLSTTGEVYSGFYFEISNGNKYTGKNPNDTPNVLLIPIFNKDEETEDDQVKTFIEFSLEHSVDGDTSFDNNDYFFNLDPTKSPKRQIPTSQPSLPTKEDYELSKFVRYFAKKNNENLYIEINKESYNLLKSQDPKIAWDLFTPQSVVWVLTGDKNKVYKTNKNIVTLTEQQNKWYGFTQWFKDKFLKYYLAT